MKAVISNRIYMKASPELIKELAEKLTYRIEKDYQARAGAFDSFEIIRTYKIVTPGIISIPQGRLDLIPKDYEIVDNRVLVPIVLPAPKFPLYPEQQVVYDEIEDTCFINALVGWGKTFTALHAAKKFGQKTLIITHSTALRDQWIEEIRELFGFEPGIIGSNRFDYDPPIVVGNVQTVTKVVPTIHKMFGTVVLDECHHVAATTFSNIIDNMHARYRIGLSGTLVRKDKKHVLFPDYFGFKIFKPAKSNTVDPEVHLYKTGIPLHGGSWVQKMNNLLYDPEYQEFIAGIALRKIQAGYKVLIVADRVEFLTNVHKLLEEVGMYLVTGSTDIHTRQSIFEEINNGYGAGICGSRQIFAEGISVNALSCLMLVVPMNNEGLLEQLAGRIQRLHPDKITPPILIDMQFSDQASRKQNNSRLGFYLNKGWVVKTL